MCTAYVHTSNRGALLALLNQCHNRLSVLQASIPASLLVLVMIILCDVGLFGFLWWANLTFNIITFIIL